MEPSLYFNIPLKYKRRIVTVIMLTSVVMNRGLTITCLNGDYLPDIHQRLQLYNSMSTTNKTQPRLPCNSAHINDSQLKYPKQDLHWKHNTTATASNSRTHLNVTI